MTARTWNHACLSLSLSLSVRNSYMPKQRIGTCTYQNEAVCALSNLTAVMNQARIWHLDGILSLSPLLHSLMQNTLHVLSINETPTLCCTQSHTGAKRHIWHSRKVQTLSYKKHNLTNISTSASAYTAKALHPMNRTLLGNIDTRLLQSIFKKVFDILLAAFKLL
jgi:hypothetical protein